VDEDRGEGRGRQRAHDGGTSSATRRLPRSRSIGPRYGASRGQSRLVGRCHSWELAESNGSAPDLVASLSW
jgi:hypothetical protein